MSLIPIIVGALGTVPKSLGKRLGELKISEGIDYPDHKVKN